MVVVVSTIIKGEGNNNEQQQQQGSNKIVNTLNIHLVEEEGGTDFIVELVVQEVDCYEGIVVVVITTIRIIIIGTIIIMPSRRTVEEARRIKMEEEMKPMMKKMTTMTIEHWTRVDGEYREYWIIVMNCFWRVMMIWHLGIMMRRKRMKRRRRMMMGNGLMKRRMRVMSIGMVMMILWNEVRVVITMHLMDFKRIISHGYHY
jgi:hypothetical protein